MARKNNSGVGRGNGSGSRRTQFQDGMPSANPEGRRRARSKPEPHTDLSAALREVLAATVKVTQNGRSKKMPWIKAMMTSLIESYPKATIREKIALLTFLTNAGGGVVGPTSRDPNPNALADFINGLAREAELLPHSDPRFPC